MPPSQELPIPQGIILCTRIMKKIHPTTHQITGYCFTWNSARVSCYEILSYETYTKYSPNTQENLVKCAERTWERTKCKDVEDKSCSRKCIIRCLYQLQEGSDTTLQQSDMLFSFRFLLEFYSLYGRLTFPSACSPVSFHFPSVIMISGDLGFVYLLPYLKAIIYTALLLTYIRKKLGISWNETLSSFPNEMRVMNSFPFQNKI